MTNDKTNSKPIELKDVYEILMDIRNSLRESSKWAKFAGIKEVKPVLESKLDTDIKKIVYVLSDGKNSTRDIEKLAKEISNRSVSNYWQEWEKSGLGESVPVMGGGNRFKKSFNLDDFGIKTPEISKDTAQSISESTQATEQPKTEVESDAN